MNGEKKLSVPARRFLDRLPAFITIFAAAAILMAGVMYVNIRSRTDMIRSFELLREQAYAMADSFELGSNTLSYEAKSYCETKDMSHFENYVRELTVTRSRDTALQALYRMGLTPREISRMQDAKIASDNLSNRELWAMELVALSAGVPESEFPQGVTPNILTAEEKALPAAEQYRLGSQSVMSADYFSVKSALDGQVREFSADLMQHYGDSTLAMTRLGTANALTSFIIIVVLVLLMVAMLRLYSRVEKENAAGLSNAMEKARAASVAKSSFLASMSHDIRTPMNAIVGMTGMAMQSLREGDSERAAGSLRVVQTSSRQLLSLVNDVLDLSRIESGRMVLAAAPYTLPDVLRDVGAIMRPLCLARSQSYSVHVSGLEHEFVIGDQVRLRQVLLNLLSNANKYTPDGGRIDFSVAETAGADPGTALYTFTVADNGIGIAGEKLAEVFEPFDREISTGFNQVEGTGLGLTIVKSIVEAHGGTVGVKSEKGRGSVFTAALPLTLQDETQALQRYGSLRGRRLLVLEESAGSCAEVCAMLARVGAESVCVSDVGRAAELAAQDGEDWLAALVEPESSPVETVRHLRAAAPGLTLVLLACEGASEALADSARAAGADGVLARPLFCSTLCEKLIELSCGARPAAAEDRYLAGRRILVVDDVEINRMIAQMLLENAGAAVEQADSGLQALEKFESSAPGFYDAILMDVMMPVMGGYEATGRIRALARGDARTVAIVAMTANAFVEDIQHSRDAGMDAHISKPVEADEVKRVFLDLLGRGGD